MAGKIADDLNGWIAKNGIKRSYSPKNSTEAILNLIFLIESSIGSSMRCHHDNFAFFVQRCECVVRQGCQSVRVQAMCFILKSSPSVYTTSNCYLLLFLPQKHNCRIICLSIKFWFNVATKQTLTQLSTVRTIRASLVTHSPGFLYLPASRKINKEK